MGGIADVFSNRWWRFDQYEIEGGYLRPSQGARLLEYNAWSMYQDQVERDRPERPYKTLVELAERIAKDPRNRAWMHGDLCSENAEDLRAWASANGLMGLLLQRTMQVSLAPRWFSLKETGASVNVDGRAQAVMAMREAYVRTPGGWSTASDAAKTGSSSPTSPEPGLAGQLVSAADLPSDWEQPRAIIESADHSLIAEPLHETWGLHFPTVRPVERDGYAYPIPLSAEFWSIYEERVGDLLFAALDLGEAARQAARFRDLSDDALLGIDDWELERIRAGLEHLQRLAGSVAPNLGRVNGRIQLAWTGPSLIGLMAMMVLLDLTSTMGLHRCDECQTLFLSSSPAARYCSDRCRWKRQKRGQRAPKEPRSEGGAS